MTGSHSKERLLPLHSRPPFPKHGKQLDEPKEGCCRLGSPLSFYLPSPHTSLLRSFPDYLTQACPPTPACIRRSRGKGLNLLVDIVPLFRISNSLLSQMSICAALVYIQRDGLCFVFVLFLHFASFKFGLSSKVRARTLVHGMKPHILLIV